MKNPIKWMVSIVVGMVLVVGLGVGAYLTYFKHPAHKGPVKLTSSQQAALQYTVPDMTTNLKSSGVVQFSVTLQASDKATLNELKELTPSIQDVLNETMRQYTMDDLTSSAGLAHLKSSILVSVNAILPKGKVTKVLLPTIVAQ